MYPYPATVFQDWSEGHIDGTIQCVSSAACIRSSFHTIEEYTAVQGLRFSCYRWAQGYHSWTQEPRHPVHVTNVYATESRTPPVLELSADRFSVGLLLHCSPPTQGQSRGMGKGVWRPCTAVLSCERGKTTHLLSIQITTNSSSL